MPGTSYFRIFTLLVAVAGAVIVTLMMVVLPARAASNEDQTAAAQEEDGGQADGPIDAQIIGGSDVPDGKYPFMAAVLDKRQGTTVNGQHICGGTLIDPNSVLTAAHCVTEGQFASDLRVAVGRTVLSTNQGQLRNVTRIYVHPDFDSETYENDVAVLKLQSPVKGIQWTLLPPTTNNRYEESGRSLRIAGWGLMLPEEEYPDRMQETRVSVLSDFWAEQFYGDAFFPKVMVAAGREDKGTCYGDSGGPLFEKVGRHYYQVGIVSFIFGENCEIDGNIAGYTEVNNPGIRSFILDRAAK